MSRMPRILELALGLAAGIALGLRWGEAGGWALVWAPTVAAALVLVLPRARAGVIFAAGLTGWALGAAAAAGAARDCRALLPDGATLAVRGALEARPWPGAAAPFHLESVAVVSRAGGRARVEARATACVGTIRVKLAEGIAAPAGVALSGVGRWWVLPPEGRWPRPPERAGVLTLEQVRVGGGAAAAVSGEGAPVAAAGASAAAVAGAANGGAAAAAAGAASAEDGRKTASIASAPIPGGGEAVPPRSGLGRRGVHPLLRARDRAQTVARAVFGRRAALVESLVLAQRTGLDQNTRDRFAAAGLSHLLSISGLHVGLVAAIVLLLARLLGLAAREASIGAAAATLLYVLFIGAPVSALRTCLQLGLLLAARLLQRPADARAPIAAAAVMLLVLSPLSLLDPGFQLSFAGVLGLVVLRPRVLPWVAGLGPSWLRESVATSVAATLATTPIAVAQFGRAAPVGVLANLAAVPLAALAVPAIGLSLGVGAAAPSLGRFLAGGASLLLDALDVVARAAAALPGGHAVVPADQALAWTLAAVACVAVAAAAHARGAVHARAVAQRSVGGGGGAGAEASGAKGGGGATGATGASGGPFARGGAGAGHGPGARSRGGARRGVWMGAGTATALLLLWPVALRVAGAGRVEIWAIDVGQGDALAIRSPAGRWLLVDAGPRDERFDAGRRRVVPFLLGHGVHRLEALVLTHPDADHIGGAAAVLESLPVGAVLEPGLPAGRPLYVEALALARRRGVRWVSAREGRELSLDGMVVRVLSPAPEAATGGAEVNEVSVIFSLSYGDFRALFMGDAPTDAEAALVAREAGGVLRATLLKVGHHGSATSTGEELLRVVSPRGAIISVGRHNRFGHPAPSTLRRLARHGVRVWRTDIGGTLHVTASAAGGWRMETAR